MIDKSIKKLTKTKQNNTKSSKLKLLLVEPILNPLWLTISEAAKIGGVGAKTIRRAIQFNKIKFKIIGNRYLVELSSVLLYLHSKTKLKNKFNQYGIGQYVDKWK